MMALSFSVPPLPMPDLLAPLLVLLAAGSLVLGGAVLAALRWGAA
jgi:hypothetical protein